MLARVFLAVIAILSAADLLYGQSVTGSSDNTAASLWSSPHEGSNTPNDRSPTVAPAESSDVSGVESRTDRYSFQQPVGLVTAGDGTLPNRHGQVWRYYNIGSYTVRVTTTKRPEQAIVDWILRETGYEVWHSEPLGILSATPRTLRVYHTPEMQAVVADLVDRFVQNEAQTCTFSLRVVTVDHPNWRARAHRLLRRVPVQTPGVGAWLLEKEDAAVLLAELRQRNDYREHSSPHLLVNNGQSTLVSAMQARSYIRDIVMRADIWPGFEAETGHVDEGFSLDFSPLLSTDRRMIDAVIKCNIDQVEKMIPVMIDVPAPTAPRKRTKIEVPQSVHFRFQERFRWPIGQVLVVGMGMVPLPVPVDGRPLVPGLPISLGTSPPRADLLVFVEAKGKAAEIPRFTRTPRDGARTYRGRY